MERTRRTVGEFPVDDAVVTTRHRPRVDPDAFEAAVLDLVEQIPAGRVLTYGDIAELLACGGPRQVGRALSRGRRDVPWWRVLRAGGHPPRGLELHARGRYDDEGTPIVVRRGCEDPGDYRVDVVLARWNPTEAEQSRLAGVGAALGRTGR